MCGNDNISVMLLKPVFEYILKPLVYLISLSLATDEVPLACTCMFYLTLHVNHVNLMYVSL